MSAVKTLDQFDNPAAVRALVRYLVENRHEGEKGGMPTKERIAEAGVVALSRIPVSFSLLCLSTVSRIVQKYVSTSFR